MIEKIIKQLTNNFDYSYSPYSNFQVSAGIVLEDGQQFYGVNIENISYSLTSCAERNAIFHGITAGALTKNNLVKVVYITARIHGETKNDFTYPCGGCRQVIAEFAHSNTKIILINSNYQQKELDFYKEVLPNSFNKIK